MLSHYGIAADKVKELQVGFQCDLIWLVSLPAFSALNMSQISINAEDAENTEKEADQICA
jgi:hypothetical protein